MQVGNYSIPDGPNRLPGLLELLKKIYDVYSRNDIKDVLKNDGLAELLSYKSSNNGSYQRKIRAFREYGLLEGKGDLRVSTRGEAILYGTETEKNKALQSAFLSIPFWNKLFEKFGKELPSNDFWLHIREITGCSPKEAQDVEETVREAFFKDAGVFSEVMKSYPDYTRSSPTEKEGRTETPQSITVQFKDDGELALTLLYRLEAYDIASDLIQFLKEKKKSIDRPEEGS